MRFIFHNLRMIYTNGNFYDELYYGITSEEFDVIDISVAL